MNSTSTISGMSTVNPIADLRSPRSLCELLHSEINTIYGNLQSSSTSPCELLDALRSANDSFGRLSDAYDTMVNTTRNHQVHQGDKEFLQKMIDRINMLLVDLEPTLTEPDSAEIEDALRSVKGSLDTFAAKIS